MTTTPTPTTTLQGTITGTDPGGVAVSADVSVVYHPAATTPPIPPPVVLGADLSVVDMGWDPPSPKVGDKVIPWAVLKNNGDTATKAGTILDVAFNWNSAVFAEDATLICWNDVNTTALAPGATVKLTATGGPQGASSAATPVNYWNAVAGTHQVLATVNPTTYRNAETNKANNALSKSLVVAAPVTPPSSGAKANIKTTLGMFPTDGQPGPVYAYLQSWNVMLNRQITVVAQNIAGGTWSESMSRAWSMGSPDPTWGQNWFRPHTNPNLPVRVTMTVPLAMPPIVNGVQVSVGAMTSAQKAASLQACVRGDYDSYFQQAIDYWIAGTAGGGANPNAGQYIDLRLGHEPEFDYYPWNAIGGGLANWKAAFVHASDYFRAHLPGCRIVFNLDGGADRDANWTPVDFGSGKTCYERYDPGASHYDLAGCDVYYDAADANTAMTSVAHAMATTRAFGASVGKPVCYPEWGFMRASMGDNPALVDHVAAQLALHAATGPGSLAYHCYFDGLTECALTYVPNTKARFAQVFAS